MPTEPEPRRRWLIAALLLLALLLGVGTYGNIKARGRVAKVQQLQKELFSKGSTLSEDDRKAKADQLRNEMRRLTTDQRGELFAAGQRQAVERMDRYFAMSPRDKQQFLDEEINRAEQRRRERPANSSPPNANRPRNDQPRSPEQIEQRRKEMLNRTTPEQRATRDRLREQMDKFREEMNKRRQQRGLPPTTGPGGFGPPR